MKVKKSECTMKSKNLFLKTRPSKTDFVKTGLSVIFIYFSYLYVSGGQNPSTLTMDASASEAATVYDAEQSDSTSIAGYTELEDLVITEKKKLIESDGAKLSYNVTEDPEAGSASILDILRKVPGVSVDAEDNVKVNGQNGFKILMNGREDPMLKGDLKTILKSLPAASIKKIEVISEPGAKYEAEGVGGILNIVTDRRQSLSGFMTQLQGWINSNQAGANVNARAKVNKVIVDALVNYNNGKISHRDFITDFKNEYIDETNNIEKIHRKSRSGWDYTGTVLNMSWEPDSLNLLTISANYGYNTWGGPRNDHRTLIGRDGEVIWDLERNIENYGKYNGTGAQVSYQHTFGKEGHNLVASYEYDFYHMNYGSDYFLLASQGIQNEFPFSSSCSKSNDNAHIFQIDYSNPFDTRNMLETGMKLNINNSQSLSQSYYGTNQSNATPDKSQTMNVTQFKDIYAGYVSYTGTYDKWNIKAGVRYEHTHMGLKYHIPGYNNFTTTLNDVIPNIAASYNLSGSASLRAAYQTRISRPTLQYINPYVNDLTPGWISYGNPDLKSELSHIVSLSYSNYEGKFGGMAKLSYHFVSNGINDVVFVKDGIINSTFANIGKDNMISLELNGNWNITNDLTWNVYTSVYYENLKSESEMLKARNSGWFCNLNTDLSYKLPCKIRMQAYGGFNTPWIDLQSKGTTGYYYGIGANRSFLKDEALTISLSASNFFEARKKSGYVQKSPTVRLNQTSSYIPWNIGVSVSWKFGGLKTGIKKTSAIIEKETSSRGRNNDK